MFFRRTGVDSQLLIEMSQSKSGLAENNLSMSPIPGFW
jgi:hypothetical protein